MTPIEGVRGLLRLLEAHVIASSERFKETKGWAHELLRDLRGMKSYMLSIQRERSEEFLSVYGGKSYILDYIIFLHTSLYLLCEEKFPLGESNNDITKEPDILIRKMHFTTSALIHLINSLLSIRILLENGLDVQAKQILRSYIEYSDLAFAVLGNETFYDNYQRMSVGEEERREVWKKYTRPGAVGKIVERIFIDMGGTRKDWNHLQDIRSELYGGLSQYTHGHFSTVLLGAYGEKVGGEIGPITLGVITKSIDGTLANAITCGYLFLKHAMIAIVKYQHLPFMEFGEQGEKFAVHYKMLELFIPFFLQASAEEERS
jgi:hypothetical protein